MSLSMFLVIFLEGLSASALLFLAAVGLSIIFGLMDILNFSHGALFMSGAYVAMTIFHATGNYPLAVLAGGCAAALLGLVMERLALRPLRGRPLYQAMVTIGVMLFLDQLVIEIWGPSLISFSRWGPLAGMTAIMSGAISNYRLFLILVGLVVFLLMAGFLASSRWGAMVRAGVENAGLLEGLGVNTGLLFTFTFGLGAFLAGVGGAVYGPFIRLVDPNLGLSILIDSFIVVVIGGFGSFGGTVLGSLLIGMLQAFIGYLSPGLTVMLNVVLMAVVLLIKPDGLMSVRRWRA